MWLPLSRSALAGSAGLWAEWRHRPQSGAGELGLVSGQSPWETDLLSPRIWRPHFTLTP